MNTRFPAVLIAVLATSLPVLAQDHPKKSGTAESHPKAAAEPAKATRPQPAHEPEEVVARVNDREIKRKELDAAVEGVRIRFARVGRRLEGPQLIDIERSLLEDIITQTLILQSAKPGEISDLDGKVKSQIDDIKTQLGGDEGLAKALEESGIDQNQYLSRVRQNIIVRETMEAVASKAEPVTADDVKNYYEQNREQFTEPETVKASHILIRVPADATDEVKGQKRALIDAVRERLKKGEKFAEVAEAVSEDPGSAANGGDLGYFPRGAMVPEFDRAAFSLGTNELSEVVTTQFGYHLLLVTDRKPEGIRSLDDVKAGLSDYLQARRQAELAHQHIRQLREAAKIEMFWEPPAQPAPVETPAVPAPQP